MARGSLLSAQLPTANPVRGASPACNALGPRAAADGIAAPTRWSARSIMAAPPGMWGTFKGSRRGSFGIRWGRTSPHDLRAVLSVSGIYTAKQAR